MLPPPFPQTFWPAAGENFLGYNDQKKHMTYLDLWPDIVGRREAPFLKHFASVFFENLFLKIFEVPYLG